MPTVIPSKKFVQIKAFHQNSYGPPSGSVPYTATQLLTLIQNIRGAIGPFNIMRFIRADCFVITDPTTTFSDWPGNMNTYFTAVKSACGGEIIPDSDLDVYFCQTDCGPTGPQGQPCGPAQWFANTQSLQQIDAIRNGLGYLLMESWAPSWYSHVNPTQADINSFFQTLMAQGWKGFIPNTNPPFNAPRFSWPDFGNAGYVRIGIGYQSVTSSPPYMAVPQAVIDSAWAQEPYLNGIILTVESQLQAGQSTIGNFGALSPTIQESTMTTIAQNQASGRYLFEYPVLENAGPNYSQYVYDANAIGTLPTIENLINTYNSSSLTPTSVSISARPSP